VHVLGADPGSLTRVAILGHVHDCDVNRLAVYILNLIRKGQKRCD